MDVVEKKKKRKSKKGGRKSKKASFKVNRRGVGIKGGKSRVNHDGEDDGGNRTYKNTYDLTKLPAAALPDQSKENAGKHSYTLTSPDGLGRIEVLLRHNAFFVKKVSPKGAGPCGQISFAKFGGEDGAWREAARRAGFDS